MTDGLEGTTTSPGDLVPEKTRIVEDTSVNTELGISTGTKGTVGGGKDTGNGLLEKETAGHGRVQWMGTMRKAAPVPS